VKLHGRREEAMSEKMNDDQDERFHCEGCGVVFALDRRWRDGTKVSFCPFCGLNMFGEHIVPAIVTLSPKARALSDADIEAIYQRFMRAEAFTARQHGSRAADWE
jgi:hypothetical protein